MLTLDLARLERENGSIHVHENLAPGAELFEGADLPFESGLTVDLLVSLLGSGEIVARGSFTGVLSRECRRCLDPVEVSVKEELSILFAPEDELEGEPDPEVRRFNLASGTIELGEAIREEVILSTPLYVECRPECRGLCPKCGTNLNESSCDCTLSEPDPRWDKLRELMTE